jgi:hypothetical protein
MLQTTENNLKYKLNGIISIDDPKLEEFFYPNNTLMKQINYKRPKNVVIYGNTLST